MAFDTINQGTLPENLSIRLLAKEIGISPGAPYRHIKDNLELLSEVACRGFQLLTTSMMDSSSGTPTLEDIGLSYLNFALDHPALYKAMFYIPANELHKYPKLQTEASKSFGLLENSISQKLPVKYRQQKTQLYAISAWAYIHGLSDLAHNQLIPRELLDDSESRQLLSGMMAGFFLSDHD